MRIFGIDPGSSITGYGVIDRDGRRLSHIDNGIIRPKVGSPYTARLGTIYDALVKLLRQFAPNTVAIEEVFVAKNVHSALHLGQARGVAILAATQAGCPVHEYPSRTVKQAIVGYGNATKEQIQVMTARLLGLPQTATTDAADALAVAITHAHTAR
ncbi:MAG: crossover junction endodeoxyribonuclease RuvC [Deltaproteobacteria bacterium]|nr:crossover junction endodeoxyribonuclease RuvC [Deltaproteobacteria bacterium]